MIELECINPSVLDWLTLMTLMTLCIAAMAAIAMSLIEIVRGRGEAKVESFFIPVRGGRGPDTENVDEGT
jgi:hypothetical protein